MTTLKIWIDNLSDGEPVEGVVFGEMGWGDYHASIVPDYAGQPKGEVLSYEAALRWLTYEFDDGYGSPECNAVTAWTKSWVITVIQYDGSPRPIRLPRNPVSYLPTMPGE